MGRTARPTHLALNRGDTRRKGEIDLPAKGRPTCPEHVKRNEVAYSKWKETVAVLDDMGVLSASDGPILELFAIVFSMWHAAVERIRANGDIADVGERGHRQVSPEYSTMNSYADQLRKLMADLCLTPATRVRLRIRKEEAKANKWDGILDFAGSA